MPGRLGPRAALKLAFVLAATGQAAQADPVTTFTLENGLNVVVIEDHRAPVVAQMIWYRVGGADEPPGHSGIAHFLEHL
ncbi:MAG TPA: insulinase family protein, partial [Tabrizicola sp.]|nr:insulinase family protein [Tabrizicola sp.]